MKNKYIAFLFLAATTFYSSCTSKLEQLPDSRMTLRTPSDVSRLLTSAYPTTYMGSLLELYSDNVDELVSPTWTSLGEAYDQMYYWNDIIADGYGDGPKTLFDGFYGAIASANEALQFINGQSNKEAYRAQLGEAYLCRAYSMFLLSNVFCPAYTETNAETALGLPYPQTPENFLGMRYERGTLGQLYKNIENDLERGLDLITSNYLQPKYHFNVDAANAFAARFYLYYRKYDKAIEYATKVLGANPTEKLRDWATWANISANEQWQPDAYIDKNVKANFLFISTYSVAGILSGADSRGQRFVPGEVLANTETMRARGPWGASTGLYTRTFSNTSLSKVMMRKIPFYLKDTDAAGTRGTPFTTFVPFNADETLMVRAEAYALSGQYDRALEDVNAELRAFSRNYTPLTLAGIKAFYDGIAYYTPTNPTPKKEFHVNFAIDKQTQEPLLQCILQLRRLLTMHEGLRMQDVKRYGITIYRRKILRNGTIEAPTDSLNASDPRLAVQLPQETILAGLQPNPRNSK